MTKNITRTSFISVTSVISVTQQVVRRLVFLLKQALGFYSPGYGVCLSRLSLSVYIVLTAHTTLVSQHVTISPHRPSASLTFGYMFCLGWLNLSIISNIWGISIQSSAFVLGFLTEH